MARDHHRRRRGAIVAWYDKRNGNFDIYVQRVNAMGQIMWALDGIALCVAANDQISPTITSDGAGGAIVTWWDFRSGTDYDIYAQRVNGAGVVQWTANASPCARRGMTSVTPSPRQTGPAERSWRGTTFVAARRRHRHLRPADQRGGCDAVDSRRRRPVRATVH
jgi:hypothetical protein